MSDPFSIPSTTATKQGQLPTIMDRHEALMRISPEYASQYYFMQKDDELERARQRQARSRTDPITAITVGAENDSMPFGKDVGEAVKFLVGDNTLEALAGGLVGYGVGKFLGAPMAKFLKENHEYAKEARDLFRTNRQEMLSGPFDETWLGTANTSIPLYPNRESAPALHFLHARALDLARKGDHLAHTMEQMPGIPPEDIDRLLHGESIARNYSRGELAKHRADYVRRTLRHKDHSLGYGRSISDNEIEDRISRLNERTFFDDDPIGGIPDDMYDSGPGHINLRKFDRAARNNFLNSDALADFITEKDKEAIRLFDNNWAIDATIYDRSHLTPLERGKEMRNLIDPAMQRIDDELGNRYTLTNTESMSTDSYPLSLKMVDEYIRRSKFTPEQTKVVFSPNRAGYNSYGLSGVEQGRAAAQKYIDRLKKISTVENADDAATAGMYHFIRLFGLAGAGLGLQNQGER